MLKSSTIALLILLSGLFISCKQSKGLTVSNMKKHHIESNIKGLGDDTILVYYVPLSKMGEDYEPIQDTIFSKNDRFAYDTPSNEPILLYLFSKKGEFTRKSGHPYRPDEKHIVALVKPTDQLNITGELKQYYLDYQVQGSAFNEQYTQVRKNYIEATSEAVSIELKLDALMAINGDTTEINDLFQKRNAVNSAGRNAHLEYIKNNPDKDLAAYYLTRQPWEIFGKYYNELSLNVRNGIFKNALESKIIKYKKYTQVQEAELKIKEGESAPDFELRSLSGNFSLNAVKTKYIVLDFWGSWCPPCTKGFPKMKAYYSKYKESIEFIGIDCNETEEKWRKAVLNYDLPWPQVINKLDIDDDVSVKYGIKAYPTKFIIDKDKKILAKFIGKDDSFYQKLDELMATK